MTFYNMRKAKHCVVGVWSLSCSSEHMGSGYQRGQVFVWKLITLSLTAETGKKCVYSGGSCERSWLVAQKQKSW